MSQPRAQSPPLRAPLHACCDNHGFNTNKSTCPPAWHKKCAPMCAANAGTAQYMGSIHPRSKIYVGKRLAKAAYNTVYGGKASASAVAPSRRTAASSAASTGLAAAATGAARARRASKTSGLVLVTFSNALRA